MFANLIVDARCYARLINAARKGQRITTKEDGTYVITINR